MLCRPKSCGLDGRQAALSRRYPYACINLLSREHNQDKFALTPSCLDEPLMTRPMKSESNSRPGLFDGFASNWRRSFTCACQWDFENDSLAKSPSIPSVFTSKTTQFCLWVGI